MLVSAFAIPSLGAMVIMALIIAFFGFTAYVYIIESRKEEAREKYVDELMKREKESG